jgi:hypothetical protein
MIAVYTWTKSTAGSLMVISMGLMSASRKVLENFMSRWSISLWDMKRSLLVSFRIRFARRRSRLGVLVSGMKRNMTMATGAEAQMDSKSDQRHDSAGTAKPERSGPRAAYDGSRS